MSDEYFKWLCDIVYTEKPEEYSEIAYTKLLSYLHNVRFTYSMQMDEAREQNGIRLRDRYVYLTYGNFDIPEELQHNYCSVLEMMVALAIKCEEDIMNNTAYGDRTKHWFWVMISNLGLRLLTDTNFDESYVEFVIKRFLNREYSPDGRGGLFAIRNCKHDLRKVDIWTQMCWYIDSIT